MNDIFIFGSNSLIAKFFIKSFYKKYNIFIISRFYISNHESYIKKQFILDLSNDFLKLENSNFLKYYDQNKIKHNKIIFLFLSWYGTPRLELEENKLEIYNINENIIQNYIYLLKKLKPDHVIFSSSSGSIYDMKSKIIRNEDSKLILSTVYAKQKIKCEYSLRDQCDSLGISLSNLRISTLYNYISSSSKQGVVSRWFSDILKNKKIELYNSLDSEINFISYLQISKALEICIDQFINGTFNLGSKRSISLESIIKKFDQIFNKKIMYRIVNNKKRFFIIDISKFSLATNLDFESEVLIDMEKYYSNIIE